VLTPPSTVPGDGSTTGPLLPEGTPSTPQTGELVAAVGVFHGGAYDLYADGRLIWHEGWSGDWFEQRLTPEGVERVRSEFLSSGLFDAAQPPSDVPPCTDRFRMCVRDDAGRLLSLAPPKSGEPPPPEASELLAHLMNLESSLPATAWADRAIKLYVPSRIAVCLRMIDIDNMVEVPLDLSTLLPLLPARAAELLGGREASSELLTSTFGGGPASWGSCFDMTLDEARTLADALLSPSGGGAHEYWGILLRFDYQPDPAQPDATMPDAAYVMFQQLLPDGLWSSVPG
jgi:hypothetical protein